VVQRDGADALRDPPPRRDARHNVVRLELHREPVSPLLRLAQLSGFEVAGALKDAPETANIPIVVLTSKEISADDRREPQSKVTSLVQKGKSAKEQLVREIKRLRWVTG
jgi:CheY-like chemotaxis protein